MSAQSFLILLLIKFWVFRIALDGNRLVTADNPHDSLATVSNCLVIAFAWLVENVLVVTFVKSTQLSVAFGNVLRRRLVTAYCQPSRSPSYLPISSCVPTSFPRYDVVQAHRVQHLQGERSLYEHKFISFIFYKIYPITFSRSLSVQPFLPISS